MARSGLGIIAAVGALVGLAALVGSKSPAGPAGPPNPPYTPVPTPGPTPPYPVPPVPGHTPLYSIGSILYSYLHMENVRVVDYNWDTGYYEITPLAGPLSGAALWFHWSGVENRDYFRLLSGE